MSASSLLLFVYAVLGVLTLTFAQHQAERSARYARAAPAPQPAQFDDLGWAWGKRSAAAPQQAQFEDLGWAWGKRSAPAASKAQFEDLGWAWGKRSAAAQAPTKWEDLGWAWGKRSGVPPTGSYRIGSWATHPEFVRFVRSWKPVKKNPDWHDLGWSWGRRK